ncbi:hypothetical protein J4217_02280 [Candidatus Pacearchaeota archaeon]|nr:hypothetical protein [Candidatus Pacearchaeota archaeon]
MVGVDFSRIRELFLRRIGEANSPLDVTLENILRDCFKKIAQTGITKSTVYQYPGENGAYFRLEVSPIGKSREITDVELRGTTKDIPDMTFFIGEQLEAEFTKEDYSAMNPDVTRKLQKAAKDKDTLEFSDGKVFYFSPSPNGKILRQICFRYVRKHLPIERAIQRRTVTPRIDDDFLEIISHASKLSASTVFCHGDSNDPDRMTEDMTLTRRDDGVYTIKYHLTTIPGNALDLSIYPRIRNAFELTKGAFTVSTYANVIIDGVGQKGGSS